MQNTAINKLENKDWENLDQIILFGFGRQGKRLYKALKNDFIIVAIVENDRNKIGITEEGVEILSFEDAKSILGKYKVVVTTAEYHYKEIQQQLKDFGLKENKDFVMYQQFVSEWYYKFKRKIYLLKTDIMVTPACSLNCENCSQFVPYWKEKKSFSIEMLKSDLDSYFRCVDFVMDMNIVGGEPFLFSKLDQYIEYIGDNYRNKIGYLGFITNGTIMPPDDTLKLINKYDIGVSISDYSNEVEYSQKIEMLCKALDKFEISYVVNKNIQWFDFGYPRKPYNYKKESCAQHMKTCNTICHCLNDGKVYYCGTAWAAEKSGIFPKDKKGYINLNNINASSLDEKKNIIECCLGNIEDGYLEFCRVCGGYGNDNDNRVVTAKQKVRE